MRNCGVCATALGQHKMTWEKEEWKEVMMLLFLTTKRNLKHEPLPPFRKSPGSDKLLLSLQTHKSNPQTNKGLRRKNCCPTLTHWLVSKIETARLGSHKGTGLGNRSTLLPDGFLTSQ